MLSAIIKKELRELLPAIVGMLMLQFLIVIAVMGEARRRVLHPSDMTAVAVGLTYSCVAFAAAIGIWQNKTEKNQGTFLFLLHRPVRREAIIGAKLLAGGGLCLLLGALPLASFAVWAERKISFQPDRSVLAFSWPICASLLLVYFGAFMSSLREARWYKSQFLPLFCGIALLILMVALSYSSKRTMLTTTLLFEISFVLAILYQGMTRDYS